MNIGTIYFSLILGIWLAIAMMAQFAIMFLGNYIYEPDKIIALIEFMMSFIIFAGLICVLIKSKRWHISSSV